MVCARVFHAIGMCEAVLMAWLPVIAHGTCVPTLHIKTAQETHILIGKYLYDVGEAGCQLLNRWLYTSRDVWDDANAVNMRDKGGGHRGAAASATMFAMGPPSGTTSTAASTTLRRIGGLLLETLEGGRGI